MREKRRNSSVGTVVLCPSSVWTPDPSNPAEGFGIQTTVFPYSKFVFLLLMLGVENRDKFMMCIKHTLREDNR